MEHHESGSVEEGETVGRDGQGHVDTPRAPKYFLPFLYLTLRLFTPTDAWITARSDARTEWRVSALRTPFWHVHPSSWHARAGSV